MENKLKAMFDYQKFERNSALEQVINSTHSRYAVRELNLDDMEWVSAAGDAAETARRIRAGQNRENPEH